MKLNTKRSRSNHSQTEPLECKMEVTREPRKTRRWVKRRWRWASIIFGRFPPLGNVPSKQQPSAYDSNSCGDGWRIVDAMLHCVTISVFSFSFSFLKATHEVSDGTMVVDPIIFSFWGKMCETKTVFKLGLALLKRRNYVRINQTLEGHSTTLPPLPEYAIAKE